MMMITSIRKIEGQVIVRVNQEENIKQVKLGPQE